jgi:hypothetical protein
MKHWTAIPQHPARRRVKFIRRTLEVKPHWFIDPKRLTVATG